MKKLLLKSMLLLSALIVGSETVWADSTAGYTPSAALSSSTGTVTGTAGETWSYTIIWHENSYYGYAASYGWQIGAGASGGKSRGCKAFSISTSGITGTITKIEVEAGSYQGNSKINVTVGGSDFGTQNQATNNGQGAQKSTFTGNASGEIVISATDAVRAFYLKSIKVTYTPVVTHTLTYSATNGSVSGVVYGTSTAVASGASVTEGGKVTLTATPASGYAFSSWSVDGTGAALSDTGTNPTTFTMGSANATVTANFISSSTPSIGLSSTSVAATTAEKDGTITVTYNNIASPNAEVLFYESDGTTSADYDWFDAEINATDNTKLDYAIGENTGAARTAYMKVHEKSEDAYSALITISQEAIVVDAPTISPAAGAVVAGTTVTLTQAKADQIRYTTDGTVPTKTTGTVYSTPISITTATTIKAIAIKNNVASDVAEATYTMKVATPTFSITGGDFDDAQDVEIFCTTEGATIHYTTNGATPTSSSPEYTAAVTISDVKTLKAIAIKDGWTNSDVASEEYRVVIPANLPFEYDGNGTGTLPSGFAVNGLGTYGTSPKMKFDSTGDYAMLKIGQAPGILSFDVKGNPGSGSWTGTFKVQTSINGSDYSDLAVYTDDISTSKETITLTMPENVRYIKWILTDRKANVALGNIKLTNTRKITLAPACTDGSKYYGTFSLGAAFVVPEGLTISTVGVNNEGKLAITDYSTGDVVKANTGVMVSSTTSGAHTVTLSNETGTENDGNLLKPSGDAGITAVNMAEANTKFYRLTMHNGNEIGFWWGAADGAAFALAANKAYLAVPSGAAVREGLWFGDDATAVEYVKPQEVDAQYYNLNGQKVQNPTKGLYIVNGKKVVIK